MPPPTAQGMKSKHHSYQTATEPPEAKRRSDITDLQRRLSHLTNAIDETLKRSSGCDNTTVCAARNKTGRGTSSPAPTRPSQVVATCKVAEDGALEKEAEQVEPQPASLVPQAAAFPVPITKPFSLVKRQDHASTDVRSTATTSAPPVPPLEAPCPSPQRSRLMSPELTHSTKERSVSVALSVAAPPTNSRATEDHRSRDKEQLSSLHEEEEDLRLRIAALKRIEEEKMELIAHQKRIIELDHERHRLEDDRRRTSSRGRASSSALAPSTSPQRHFIDTRRRVSPCTDEDVDVDQGSRRNAAVSLAPTDQHAAVMHPSSSTGTGGVHYARSPSPILRLSSVSPSPSRDGMQALRDAIMGSAAPHPPTRWLPTAKGDQRLVCRELLVERGVDAKVLTGHNRAVACRVHLSPNHQELLALPTNRDGGITESHHFPLRGAAILYPNGLIQHSWPPKRVHVSGVVVGNRAKSVLIAKGCPYFIDTDMENRPRLYLVIGGDAYAEDATLLVLQFPTRIEWLCALLGVHGAMWPDGKPPLTAGRALWLYACHAVTQLHWEANAMRDTLWHQSRRRSRSAEPHKRVGITPSTSITSTPEPAAMATDRQRWDTVGQPSPIGPLHVPAVATPSSRFALPQRSTSHTTSPPRFAVPIAHTYTRERVPTPVVQPTSNIVPAPVVTKLFLQNPRMETPQSQQQPLGRLPNGYVTVPSKGGGVPPTPTATRTFFPKSTVSQRPRPGVLQYGY
jgi:hypothetical protein